uniref:Uncharacterized protein n=1 Tax=Anguilla anguilla TaxID=7936 RepID=A0A0E9RXG6_ANGAN
MLSSPVGSQAGGLRPSWLWVFYRGTLSHMILILLI